MRTDRAAAKLRAMINDAPGKISRFLATKESAPLGPGPRPGVFSENALAEALDPVLSAAPLTSGRRQLIRALLLLWHDHLDASHTISQGIENSDGSLVHAIMHRREPDYWNSKYWWRRVGHHPCFPELARRAGEFLQATAEPELAAKLVPHGKWDPFAFVDACEAASGLPASDPRLGLLREIQRIETEMVLAYFLA